MRYLEVRRHTMRPKPGQHLSQAGVDLARRIGEDLGPFEYVVTSVIPRAFETAIAMGFAVDEQIEQLGVMDAAIEMEVGWPATFAEYARAMKLGGATARFGRVLAEVWRGVVERVSSAGNALIITHGGIIEIGATGCLPQADHSAWGDHCSYCEGVRLGFDGEVFVTCEILRVGG